MSFLYGATPKVPYASAVEGVKQGFSAPDASWFRGERMDYVRDRPLDRFGAHLRLDGLRHRHRPHPGAPLRRAVTTAACSSGHCFMSRSGPAASWAPRRELAGLQLWSATACWVGQRTRPSDFMRLRPLKKRSIAFGTLSTAFALVIAAAIYHFYTDQEYADSELRQPKPDKCAYRSNQNIIDDRLKSNLQLSCRLALQV